MTEWDEVAAPGTDPATLARLVQHVVAGPGTAAIGRLVAGAAAGLPPPEPATALRRALDACGAKTAASPPDGADIVEAWARAGVRVACLGDPLYPQRLLADWPRPGLPLLLAWRGAPPHRDTPAVAIVGARRATPYGTGIAGWLAEAASAAGVTVVSGGAVGIDAAAHAAALRGGGGTQVVLGCGHGVPYPSVHARPGGLFDRILHSGGTVLSEHLPRTRPRPGVVRERNRIVAALADAVVVVEGGARSGSLLTAGAAADLGIPVLAVPGDVRRPGSTAPHRLLAEGAAPCTGPADLLDVLPDTAAATPTPAATVDLPPALLGPLQAAWPAPLRVDDLAAASGLPIARVLVALTRAALAGEVAEDADGVRLCRPP